MTKMMTRSDGVGACAGAGLRRDRIGHAAVCYFGALFAAVGIIGLLALVPAEPRS